MAGAVVTPGLPGLPPVSGHFIPGHPLNQQAAAALSEVLTQLGTILTNSIPKRLADPETNLLSLDNQQLADYLNICQKELARLGSEDPRAVILDQQVKNAEKRLAYLDGLATRRNELQKASSSPAPTSAPTSAPTPAPTRGQRGGIVIAPEAKPPLPPMPPLVFPATPSGGPTSSKVPETPPQEASLTQKPLSRPVPEPTRSDLILPGAPINQPRKGDSVVHQEKHTPGQFEELLDQELSNEICRKHNQSFDKDSIHQEEVLPALIHMKGAPGFASTSAEDIITRLIDGDYATLNSLNAAVKELRAEAAFKTQNQQIGVMVQALQGELSRAGLTINTDVIENLLRKKAALSDTNRQKLKPDEVVDPSSDVNENHPMFKRLVFELKNSTKSAAILPAPASTQSVVAPSAPATDPATESGETRAAKVSSDFLYRGGSLISLQEGWDDYHGKFRKEQARWTRNAESNSEKSSIRGAEISRTATQVLGAIPTAAAGNSDGGFLDKRGIDAVVPLIAKENGRLIGLMPVQYKSSIDQAIQFLERQTTLLSPETSENTSTDPQKQQMAKIRSNRIPVLVGYLTKNEKDSAIKALRTEGFYIAHSARSKTEPTAEELYLKRLAEKNFSLAVPKVGGNLFPEFTDFVMQNEQLLTNGDISKGLGAELNLFQSREALDSWNNWMVDLQENAASRGEGYSHNTRLPQ